MHAAASDAGAYERNSQYPLHGGLSPEVSSCSHERKASRKLQRFAHHGLRRKTVVEWPATFAGSYLRTRLQCAAYVDARRLHRLL